MGQPIRYSKERPPAYWETIRDRIECGKAVQNLNQLLEGVKLDAHQERATYFTINKLLPSLQAIAVQVEHKVAPNRDDLVARALARGIDPDMLFRNHQAIDYSEKK